MMQWGNDTMIQWCNDAMIKWYNDTMIQWYNDTVIQCYIINTAIWEKRDTQEYIIYYDSVQNNTQPLSESVHK